MLKNEKNLEANKLSRKEYAGVQTIFKRNIFVHKRTVKNAMEQRLP